MKEKRNKYDVVMIIVLIAVALLIGAGLGYEKGVNVCKEIYQAYISRMCLCTDGRTAYMNVTRSIPEHLFSNISINISKK